MEKSIEGISEACQFLETPVISGNVSMYNQSKEEAISPTPIIGMVGLHESCTHVTPSTFQEEGNLIYVIGETEAAFGGSELQNIVQGTYTGNAPAIDLQVEEIRQEQLLHDIYQGVVQSN